MGRPALTSRRCASTILHLCPRRARRRTIAHALVGRNGDGCSRGLGAAGRTAAGSRPVSGALGRYGNTPVCRAMDAGGGNAGGGGRAVECLLVRRSVALDHAGNLGRRAGTDRAGRVVYRCTPLWLEATPDSRSKESGLTSLRSEFSHPRYGRNTTRSGAARRWQLVPRCTCEISRDNQQTRAQRAKRSCREDCSVSRGVRHRQ